MKIVSDFSFALIRIGATDQSARKACEQDDKNHRGWTHGTKLWRGNLRFVKRMEKLQHRISDSLKNGISQKAWDLTVQARSVAIVAHQSPDGDAVGSCLALHHFLNAKGIDNQVVLPDRFARFLAWMPGANDVIFFDEDPERADAILNDVELIWCLDFNSPQRAGKLSSRLSSGKAKIITLDHHQQPDAYSDLLISDIACGSTCELVFDLILAWDGLESLDVDCGTCIYTGIMTDTGSFRFNSVTSHTHLILSHLLDLGVNHSAIHEHTFDAQSETRMKLCGYAISAKLVVSSNGPFAWISLTQEELVRFNYESGDTEGLVNQALAIEGVEVAIFLKESEEGVIKVSLRSVGDWNVRDIADAYFSGGGHRNASGGIVKGRKMEEVLEWMQSLMPQWEKYRSGKS